MAHISRIDLTRDFNAHREEFLEAITKVCEETAFSGGKYADKFDEEFAEYIQNEHFQTDENYGKITDYKSAAKA